MPKELTRTSLANRRNSWVMNTITFPSALRDAIPELPVCDGRVLKLDSISAKVSDSSLLGTRVRLMLVAQETGKLDGEFKVLIDIDTKAARALAETLKSLCET
jgi:hypothetical protein